jgi:hypothetical protein
MAGLGFDRGRVNPGGFSQGYTRVGVRVGYSDFAKTLTLERGSGVSQGL